MSHEPTIAIVYDRLNKFGGAERVLQELYEIFPHAVFFTSVYSASLTPWTKGWEIRTSFLQRIPFFRRHHEWLALWMPLAFESLDCSKFDIVISVTSEAAKAVITKPNQLHVCYCLTPTRYLWSHTLEYEKGFVHLLKRKFFSSLRIKDFLISKRPDAYIAISKHIQDRIQKYYREPSMVIYPPVQFANQKLQNGFKEAKSSDFFLVVSRLVPYKHVEIAIQACLQQKEKLVVVGSGSDLQRLQMIAGNSSLITFKHNANDEELQSLYTNAKALLCPQEEDFGIVSVEAQAYGTPVLSYINSGVAETIIDGKTGILFPEQTVKSLISAMQQLEAMKIERPALQRHAQQFSSDRFQKEMRSYIDLLWAKQVFQNTLQ